MEKLRNPYYSCYKHSEETPQQINLTGLKRGLKDPRFLLKIRFGWETEPTGPGSESEETPQQINLTGLKRGLKDPRFLLKIRFGWETEPTGPGSEAVIFSKIDPYGAVFLLGVFLLGYFCVLIGVFAWVFLRISAYFCGFPPGNRTYRV